MVTTAQHREGEIARGPDGQTAVFRGGQWVVQGAAPSSAPAAARPASPAGIGLIQLETPSEARAQRNEERQLRNEERTIDRQAQSDAIEMRRLELAEEAAGLRGDTYGRKFQEAIATKDANRFSEAVTGWSGAGGLEANAQSASALLDADTPVGPFADQRILAGRVAGDFLGFLPGVPTRDQTRNLEQLRRLGDVGALGDVGQLKGALSEKELAFVQRLQFDPNASRETNQMVADTQAWMARRQAAYGSAMQRWTQDLGSPSRPNPRGQSFDAWWGTWSAQNLPRPDLVPAGSARQAAPEDAAAAVDQAVGGADAPQAGDVRTTSQPLAPEDTPNSLSAQGYVYDASTDTWRRSRQEQAPTPEQRGWTPESAVEQRRDMNPLLRRIDAGARGFADAAGLEFPDEIAAGADALFGQGVGDNIGDRYRNNLEVQRAIDAADGEDVGLSRNIGQGLGFAATAGIVAPRMLSRAGANLASPVLRAVAPLGLNAVSNALRGISVVKNGVTGAAIAGTAAAGQEEGNALERAQAFLKAAPVGAFVGAVAPPVVNALSRPLVGAATSVGRAAQRGAGWIGERAGVRGATALRERATPSALDTAVERFAQRTRPNADVLAARQAEQQGLGLSPALVDTLDDGGVGLIRANATRQAGTGRQTAVDFGRERRVNAQSDASDLARRFVSDDPRTAAKVADDLEREQSRLSALEMGPIRDKPITISAEAAQEFRTPGGQQALSQASRWVSNAQDAEQLARLAGIVDDVASPGPIAPVEMTLGTLDRLRRSLGNQIRAARTAQDGDTVNSLSRALRGLRGEATQQVPEYGQFLSNYAERAQLDDALTLGSKFLGRRGTAQYALDAGGLPDAGRAVARVAARDAIEDIAGTPAGAAGVLDSLAVGRGASQRSGGLVDDPEGLARTADAMQRRIDVGRRVDPRYGSNTNLNMQDSAVTDGLDIAGDVVSAAKLDLPAATRLVRRFQARGFSDVEAEALVRAAVDPAMTTELIAMLSQRMSRREARSLARAVQRSVASGQGSSSAQ